MLSDAELDAIAGGGDAAAPGLVARWDTAAGYGEHGIDDLVPDVAGNGLHGHGVHQPVRAMTGWNWDGSEDDWRLAPEQYGAIHFHDDDLDDCRLGADVRAGRCRPTCRSGVYAAAPRPARPRTTSRSSCGPRADRDGEDPVLGRPPTTWPTRTT